MNHCTCRTPQLYCRIGSDNQCGRCHQCARLLTTEQRILTPKMAQNILNVKRLAWGFAKLRDIRTEIPQEMLDNKLKDLLASINDL